MTHYELKFYQLKLLIRQSNIIKLNSTNMRIFLPSLNLVLNLKIKNQQ